MLGNPAVMHSGGFKQSRSHARLAFQRDSFKTFACFSFEVSKFKISIVNNFLAPSR